MSRLLPSFMTRRSAEKEPSPSSVRVEKPPPLPLAPEEVDLCAGQVALGPFPEAYQDQCEVLDGGEESGDDYEVYSEDQPNNRSFLRSAAPKNRSSLSGWGFVVQYGTRRLAKRRIDKMVEAIIDRKGLLFWSMQDLATSDCQTKCVVLAGPEMPEEVRSDLKYVTQRFVSINIGDADYQANLLDKSKTQRPWIRLPLRQPVFEAFMANRDHSRIYQDTLDWSDRSVTRVSQELAQLEENNIPIDNTSQTMPDPPSSVPPLVQSPPAEAIEPIISEIIARAQANREEATTDREPVSVSQNLGEATQIDQSTFNPPARPITPPSVPTDAITKVLCDVAAQAEIDRQDTLKLLEEIRKILETNHARANDVTTINNDISTTNITNMVTTNTVNLVSVNSVIPAKRKSAEVKEEPMGWKEASRKAKAHRRRHWAKKDIRFKKSERPKKRLD